MAGVQIGTVLGLPLGSPRIKSHLDAGVAERCKEYFMGEGGGFPGESCESRVAHGLS